MLVEKKDNTNLNILLPIDEFGFIRYEEELDSLFFTIEYSFD